MNEDFQPYVPKNFAELFDHLSFMMLRAPLFVDKTGYLPGQNLDTTFYALNEGLKTLRNKLGQERYSKLMDMSDRMRAYFEADPEKNTGGTLKGRELILDMEELIKQRNAKR
jgi:hypothetical protein